MTQFLLLGSSNCHKKYSCCLFNYLCIWLFHFSIYLTILNPCLTIHSVFYILPLMPASQFKLISLNFVSLKLLHSIFFQAITLFALFLLFVFCKIFSLISIFALSKALTSLYFFGCNAIIRATLAIQHCFLTLLLLIEHDYQLLNLFFIIVKDCPVALFLP